MTAPSVKDRALEARIPNRLAELYVFIQVACDLEAADAEKVRLAFGKKTFVFSRNRILRDTIADGAVVVARALLTFLGLSLKDGKLDAYKMAKKDDLTMEDLGLRPVAPEDAIAGWPMGDVEAKRLLELCLEAGNKVSGHLTKKTSKDVNAEIVELSKGFQLVIDLVNREVYSNHGRAIVEFVPNGRHGFIGRSELRDAGDDGSGGATDQTLNAGLTL